MSSKTGKRNGKQANASSPQAGMTDGFVVLSDAEMGKIRRREQEYKHMQAKLTRENAAAKGRRNTGVIRNAGLHSSSAVMKMAHAAANRDRSDKRRLEELQLYMASIINPFEVQGARIPNIEPIPTSTFRTWRDVNLEFTNSSNHEPGSLRIIAPCHYAKEFAATGNDGTPGQMLSTFNLPSGGWGHPYYSSGVASLWPSGGATLGVSDVTSGAVNGMIALRNYFPADKAADVINLYSHVRMVSAGIRISYTGPVLNTQGRVCVAQLPPGVGVPFNETGAATNIMQPTQFDFSWDAVTHLPGAQIFPIGKDFETFLKPYSEEVEDWCPTSYVPKYYTYPQTRSLGTFSAPPCTGYPDRFKALCDATCISSQATGGGAGFFNDIVWHDGANCDNPWGAIVVIFEDGDQTGGKVNMQLVANWEGIPESRTLSLAMPRGERLAKSTAGDGASMIRSLVYALPGSHAQGSGFWSKVGVFLKKGLETGGRFLAEAGGTRAVLGKLGDELGIEIPSVFGDIAVGLEAMGL